MARETLCRGCGEVLGRPRRSRMAPPWHPRCLLRRWVTRRRLGRVGRARVQAGRRLITWLIEREGGRCFVCRAPGPLDRHHVVKRSQGGADNANNLLLLCRTCHDKTDAAYSRGRLLITPLDGERFTWRVVRKANKWADEGPGA